MASRQPHDEERTSFLGAPDSCQDAMFQRKLAKKKRRRLPLLICLFVGICWLATTAGYLLGKNQVSRGWKTMNLLNYHKIGDDAKTYAYATYATGTHSLCDATVAFRTLAEVSRDKRGPVIDRVLVVPDNLDISAYEEQFELLQVRIFRYPRILIEEEKGVYRESLNKLRVFQLPYDRVVYFDNDAVFLRNTDQLFLLADWAFYAPRAYWLQQPWFQSTLMVIQPSNETFIDILEHFKKPMEGHAWFDMDVLNDFFKNQVAYLSPTYVILNTEFQRPGQNQSTVWHKTVNDLANEAYIVHFSTSPKLSYGKPDYRQPIRDAEKSHPMFEETFNMYWNYQEQMCRPL